MMICARCDQPMGEDEPYESQYWNSPSGPGTTWYLHVRCDSQTTEQGFATWSKEGS